MEALLQAQFDDGVRVVAFTGSGRAFCAGDDLQAYGTHDGGDERRVSPIPPGHGSPIATYGALRGVSQALNRAVRELDNVFLFDIDDLDTEQAAEQVARLLAAEQIVVERARKGRIVCEDIRHSLDFRIFYLLVLNSRTLLVG